MNIYELNNRTVLANGFFILVSIYVIRLIYLKSFRKENSQTELFIAPRGLISILLYYNLPAELKVPEIGASFLFMVVLGSSLVMSAGLLASRKGIMKPEGD